MDSLINTFLAQPHRRIIGKAVAEVTADLLRTPPLTKQLGNHSAEVIVGVDSASVMTCSTRGGSPMSIKGLIAAAGRHVTSQLPRNRRRRSTKSEGDRPHAQPRTTPIGDLDALVLGQVSRTDLADR
jgi:DNA-binding IclR family transcriptional regulator